MPIRLLPWKYAVFPSLGRWSLCSQEYSYMKGRIIATLFFGSKTLPVLRGGGVDHEVRCMFGTAHAY